MTNPRVFYTPESPGALVTVHAGWAADYGGETAAFATQEEAVEFARKHWGKEPVVEPAPEQVRTSGEGPNIAGRKLGPTTAPDLDAILGEMRALGQAYRMDWSDVDGRTLRMEFNEFADRIAAEVQGLREKRDARIAVLTQALTDLLDEQQRFDTGDHAGECDGHHIHRAKLCLGCETTYLRLAAKRERARVLAEGRD